METYGPSRPSPHHTVNHVDGDKRNLDLGNLEWVTYSGNLKHAYDLNLRNKEEPVLVMQTDKMAIQNISRARREGKSYKGVWFEDIEIDFNLL